MTRTKLFGLLVLSCIVVAGCKDVLDRDARYQRPEWLAGKVYTQVKADPELSTFAKCIELSGYDTIIDVSGSYTVFAPDNEAFTIFFQEHPQYNTVEDIPKEDLLKLVKFHIVQNPWTRNQLMSLDVFGWIDSSDVTNNQPKGYKRETLLLEQDRKYGVKYDEDNKIFILDTTQASWTRKVITDSRKYAPIFFKDYFDIYNLNSDDYQFYFNRPIESPTDIYFAGARITGQEIFAENGFVYHVDRVVDPMPNAYEIISSTDREYSYQKFMDMINKFPDFNYNEEKTFNQPGADLGFAIDSLFELHFPKLTFDITNEATSAPPGVQGLPDNVTIRYHHGMVAPTDEAFTSFVNTYFVGPNRWGSIEEAPDNLKNIIVNTHLCTYPVYPTNFQKGYLNGEDDLVVLNQDNIVEKEYSSNSTFIGVSKMIIPRAFISITGPIYLQRTYNKVMLGIEKSGLLPALKRENKDYQFYVESDVNTRLDSSFLYDERRAEFFCYTNGAGSSRKYVLTNSDLRNLLLNQLALERPKGGVRKEFIKTFAGNYLIINNETGEVSGTAPTTIGYKGLEKTQVIPNQISTDADNGVTWEVSDWFSFSTTTMFLKIQGAYPRFQALLTKAGLTDNGINQYKFTSPSEVYTVFIPTDAALDAYQVDTLKTADLKKFLLMHFVHGDMIFTDGRKMEGYYQTARVDDRSTPYTTIFSEIYIKPGNDMISFKAKDGSTYTSVSESATTNMVAGRLTGQSTDTYPTIVTNAVIHQIDSVLIYNRMDTR